MRKHERRYLDRLKKAYPEKFVSNDRIFSNIRAGDRIFIGTGCGEPQYLVRALIDHVEKNPGCFFDAEVLQVWTLGVAPYTSEKFKYTFRHNSFFIGDNTRDVVNRGQADYTPVFLSRVPSLFRRGLVPIDVALIQTSTPDRHGFLSLGISVDIVKAAAESANLVIVQINPEMPRVHGDTFISAESVDFFIIYEEPLLQYKNPAPGDVTKAVGRYVAEIVEDGDTIQVGYGSIPNAILSSLAGRKNLGVHSELLTDGIIELMKTGVINNSCKTLDRGKTVASFCMGTEATYRYIRDNPAIEMRSIEYTNSLLTIAGQKNIVAINSALEVDLTGQVSSESIGKFFYSGIGGQADFIRGAALAPGGKAVIALQSTTEDGKISRIVPFLKEGAGVTLTRGDIGYVVTEYGRAYLHGKNIRERAMALIAIAHPRFRPWLIEEAKKLSLIYADQAFLPGEKGEYPYDLETYRTTKTGLTLFLRPVKLSDEPLLKEFFYAVSDASRYKRFASARKDMPHEILQKDFVVIDYTEEMELLAIIEKEGRELVVGIGQYGILAGTLRAEIGLIVRDDFHRQGIGGTLLSAIIHLAVKQGLLELVAEVMTSNTPTLELLKQHGFTVEKRPASGMIILTKNLRTTEPAYVT